MAKSDHVSLSNGFGHDATWNFRLFRQPSLLCEGGQIAKTTMFAFIGDAEEVGAKVND
ncbi:MAG: hypothetical protein U5N27_03540 [Rhizobium sp.]|nr:hypothetical protein [Rhizobium sp.]